ncbi:transcriptional regulatory protein ume6 [Seiridium cupressi]
MLDVSVAAQKAARSGPALKAEVKTKARQRRGQKALRRIQANLLDASGSAESHNGPTPPPSTASPILSEQFQSSQKYTTTAASSPSVTSSTALLTGPTLPTLSAAHEYEIGLVITYLDHVFPLLFPFYQPQILEGGRTWLLSAIAKNEGSDTNNSSKNILQLTRINGCQNWVMSLLAEIYVLNSWKKDQRRTLSPYIDMLSHRVHEIQSRLQDGLLRLDPSNEASDDATFLDGSAPGSMPPTSVVTRLWPYAELAYLHVILSGWKPLKEEIRNAVVRGIELLHELSSSVRHLRAQAWPYCIIGWMALESERLFFRKLRKRLGPLAKFGSIGVSMNILENIWTNSPPADPGNWDIAACLSLLGHPVLLV